eukprot:COSAG02_NODE_4028_length_5886_cov_2.738552_2_plen_112_part_00
MQCVAPVDLDRGESRTALASDRVARSVLPQCGQRKSGRGSRDSDIDSSPLVPRETGAGRGAARARRARGAPLYYMVLNTAPGSQFMKLRPLRFMNSNAVPRLSQEIFLRSC